MNDCYEVKVSIIIPSYNTEKYIGQCLESILNQSIREIEVICIVGGSTDGTFDIIKNYEEKDERIKIVSYSENKGLSYDRNIGMDMARGKYIYFLDSDDYVREDMLEKLLDCAEANHADGVFFDGEIVYDNYIGFIDSKRLPADLANKVFTGQEFFVKITNINKHQHGVWRYFWNHAFLKKSGIRFPNGLFAEDVYFTLLVMLSADRFIYLNESLHYYRKNNSSLTSGNPVFTFVNRFKIYCKLIKEWKNREFQDDVENAIDVFMTRFLSRCRRIYYMYDDKIFDDMFEAGEERHLFKALIALPRKQDLFRISDRELKTIKNSSEVIVYGAGEYASEVLMYLERINVHVDAIAVTKKNTKSKTITKLPVYDVDELKKSHVDATIIIGIKDNNKKDIIENLRNRNVNNIINLELIDDF